MLLVLLLVLDPCYLQERDLSFNNLSGSIPDSLFNAAALTNLFLGSNKLTGSLPQQMVSNLQNILWWWGVLGSLVEGRINFELGLAANCFRSFPHWKFSHCTLRIMGWMDQNQFCATVVIFLTLLSCISVSAYSSDGISGDEIGTGRHLQASKKGCPINFEFQNYTIITSQCKGPRYPPKRCCKAFKEFACPFAKYLNDLSNGCATIMFSYINLYGKYPPGLFASMCRREKGKSGLTCPPHRP